MRLPRGVRRAPRIEADATRVDREVAEELEFHFEQAVRDGIDAGLDEEEAIRSARRRFGDERAYRDTLERIDRGRVRMRVRSQMVEAVVRTVVHAFRSVRRGPGFAASVITILALGIGANAVMFGVVDRLLLSPPEHVVEPESVRTIHIRRQIFNGDVVVGGAITYPDLLDFRDVGAFASVAAFSGPREQTVGRGESVGQAQVASVSAALFPLLGVHPHIGRFFGDTEEGVESAPTAVLSWEYWERERGRDPGVLGRTIDVGQGTYEIVGVAPEGFTGPQLAPVDIWVPAVTAQTIENGSDWLDSRGWYWLSAVARLAPEITDEAATAEATAAHRAGRAEMIEQDRYDENVEVVIAPLIAAQGPSPTSEAQVTRWLAGVSLIVLLIACFNAANLLLARATRARREIAVRLALGVHRRRLVGEVVAESVLLAALGAAAGLLVAVVLNGPVRDVLLPNVSFSGSDVGRRVLFFTVVVAVGAGVLAAILPALQASRAVLTDALASGGRGLAGSRSRARVALLVSQAALSVILLVGAGLFVRSLRAASGLDLGYEAEEVAVLRLEWNETLGSSDRLEIYEQVLERMRSIPGTRAAALSYTVPFWSSITLGQPRIPGLDSIPRHHEGGPYVNKVSSGYFEAMGLTVLRGRAFSPADDGPDAPPVALISESMARAIWPAGDALGACMMFGQTEDAACTEVVGVVENHNRQELVEADPHFLYFLNQHHDEFQGPPQALMVGTEGSAVSTLPALRTAAAATSSQIRFVAAEPLSDFVAPALRSWRLGASMFTAFGVLALIVAGLGLYSVLAFDVALRRHELGVRSAIGASAAGIVRLVLVRATSLVGLGTAVGLAAAWAAARFVQPLLFDVSATDPLVYGGVAAALITVGCVAGSLPAMRASRVDPREALQTD